MRYLMQRVELFWNPLDDPFRCGYQLTQSIMTFGQGRFWRQRLGNSVQYLPEAHTDFIFAILNEELGYFGSVLALLMVFWVALRIMSADYRTLEINQCFSGFLAYFIDILSSLQALINVSFTSWYVTDQRLDSAINRLR